MGYPRIFYGSKMNFQFGENQNGVSLFFFFLSSFFFHRPSEGHYLATCSANVNVFKWGTPEIPVKSLHNPPLPHPIPFHPPSPTPLHLTPAPPNPPSSNSPPSPQSHTPSPGYARSPATASHSRRKPSVLGHHTPAIARPRHRLGCLRARPENRCRRGASR